MIDRVREIIVTASGRSKIKLLEAESVIFVADLADRSNTIKFNFNHRQGMLTIMDNKANMKNQNYDQFLNKKYLIRFLINIKHLREEKINKILNETVS